MEKDSNIMVPRRAWSDVWNRRNGRNQVIETGDGYHWIGYIMLLMAFILHAWGFSIKIYSDYTFTNTNLRIKIHRIEITWSHHLKLLVTKPLNSKLDQNACLSLLFNGRKFKLQWRRFIFLEFFHFTHQIKSTEKNKLKCMTSIYRQLKRYLA